MSLFTEWSKLEMVNLGSVHNKVMFLGVSRTRGLEVTNTPGTSKAIGSNLNLTVPVFLNGKYSGSKKKCRLIICLLMYCRLRCF